ncbi:hypothetical protein ACFSMW_06685 [Virgibacillus halophilus]|uniref:Uncharacterized protein n=1 Tax=Tigheibacillus halophilus TaxID=361280 RepID=A0ABU5C622_9BACI|nr:hypothetical protein [Virgibacillus halophilus]
MDDLQRKIIMWKKELERQEASMGVKMIFDSICVYLGEQERKKQELIDKNELLNNKLDTWMQRTFQAQERTEKLYRITKDC